MEISKAIQASRPNLSPSSVKTYTSILGSLHRKIWGADEIDLANFKDTKQILAFLKDVAAPKRKTVLSSLVVLTGLDEYRKQMMADIGVYNDAVKSQVMSEKQKASDVSPAEVKAVYDALAARAAELYKKKAPTVGDLLQIQEYVLMALMSGTHISPRRSLDWTAFKLRNFDTDPPDLSVIPPRLVPVTPATSTTPPAPAAAAKPPRDTRTIDGDKAPGKANGDGAARKFVRQGMTEAEVIAKLGRPDATAGGSKQQQTRWSYLPTPDDPDTVTTITFAGGTVSDITRKVIKR